MSETNVAAQITTSANTETNQTPAVETTAASTQATILDTKPAEVKAPEVPADKAAETANSEAKTDVTFELKLPENSLLDQTKVDEVLAYAKAKGLNNEQAQDLLNREDATLKTFIANQNETLAKVSQEWKQQAMTDKEIGGPDFNKNVEMAHRAIKQYGNETLINYLNESGLGNHPDVVRMFMRIGKAMADDKIITSSSKTTVSRSLEDVFYPGNNQ
jgi:hypothetical protein